MKKISVAVLVLLAVLSAIVAGIYFSKTAGTIPHFFLGYASGSSHKHVKHGIAFAGLAVVLLLGAWMVSGQSAEEEVTKKPDNLDNEN